MWVKCSTMARSLPAQASVLNMPKITKSPGGDDDISWTEKFHAEHRDTYNGNGASWEAVPSSEKPLIDTVEADWVVARLEDLAPAALLGQENFFLGWGLHRPHLPFLFPEQFADHYPEEAVELPANPWAPVDMPPTAWSDWRELRGIYTDCSNDALGIPDLGEVNVTLPDWKTKELRCLL
jgi:iduronate 2-sulfatase